MQDKIQGVIPTPPANWSGRVIRMKELVALIGLSRSTIYDRLNPKSRRYDKHFPKPLQLGENSISWFEHQIYSWCQQQVKGE